MLDFNLTSLMFLYLFLSRDCGIRIFGIPPAGQGPWRFILPGTQGKLLCNSVPARSPLILYLLLTRVHMVFYRTYFRFVNLNVWNIVWRNH